LLCVLSNVLGNRTFSAHLRDAIDGLPDVLPTYVTIDSSDYATFRSPLWTKLSAPFEAEWLARRKVAQLDGTRYDAVIANGWEFAIGLRRLAESHPFALSLDTTPALLIRMRRGTRHRRRATRVGSRMALVAHHLAFRAVLSRLDMLLPQSAWCAESLRVHYDIPDARCVVTFCPQDLDRWRPQPKERAERLRLLFVGNDFSRKGGEFLLELFATRLASFCMLAIASNDSSLAQRTLPAGVTLIPGLDRVQLLMRYQTSDLLILPTRYDQLPHVISEACATGLPTAASDIGGIRDLVHDNKTGLLLAPDSSADTWAARIRAVWEDPSQHERLAQGARSIAERLLDVRVFRARVAGAISALRSSRKARQERGVR
jgi:glycosyltransferase involved in cell wall biosynthesis